MREDVAQRCLDMARHMADTGATVRETAKVFSVSKSLAHRELTTRLKILSPTLYAQVRRQLLYHKAVRHLRGGEATKRRFAREKSEKVGNHRQD